MPPRPLVYANCNTRVGFEGSFYVLKADQPWDAGDPLVKKFPHLFDKQPTRVGRSVEQATKAPGEKRAR
mgnify:CR=1 FL=1